MRAAVSDAERGAQVSVDSLTLGIGGGEVRGVQSRGLYEFGRPREIDHEDLVYAVELAADVLAQRTASAQGRGVAQIQLHSGGCFSKVKGENDGPYPLWLA